MPLGTGVFGSLFFLARQTARFSEADLGFARRVADLLALALSHQRLAEADRRDAAARETAAQLEAKVATLTRELESRTGQRRVVGHSPQWKDVLAHAARVAQTETTVLLTGESGTGKEVVARFIHQGSRRKNGPFVAINCAALPDQLLESELFGHERGAFTGAVAAKPGRIEQASGGVLFLDEVGEMAPAVQAKLLRVLEEREFRRVGGEDTIRVDVRVIAATNRGLREDVQLGKFRRDLYHRLNVLHIDLPALRERREDIPRLIEQFIQEFSRQHDRSFRGIEPEALQLLVDYSWPGNVRELRNLLESMVVLAPGRTIRPEDIPSEVRGGRGALLPVPLSEVHRHDGGSPAELEFILRTLFDLKLDVDDLRREFESYRQRRRQEPDLPLYPLYPSLPAGGAFISHGPPEPEPVQEVEREDTVVYRAGMTMQDLEREAIALALKEVRGNRRKAAENLGIGERTLYRKIKDYGIEV
jgi:DNA-binding NtrC family response regulator